MPQRDPITLAKEVASLDHLSNGRFLFGIGAGWNRPEVENHGVKFSLRWRRMREQILAMKEIWTSDEAEFHGDYVNFDQLWSWPKPVQKPHPPIIMGGDGPFAERGLVEYARLAAAPGPQRGAVPPSGWPTSTVARPRLGVGHSSTPRRAWRAIRG